MNRDDIIRMAREAKVYSGANEIVFAASLERFAALVAAAERESCAELCESQDPYVYSERTANACASAIRSRSNE